LDRAEPSPFVSHAWRPSPDPSRRFTGIPEKTSNPTPASLVEGGFTVLVVDDEQEIVELIRNYFQRHGSYEVVTASDGISALLEVGRVKPDLLILDIMIPGVDGIEVCRRIKNDPSNKTVIIAVSGTADKEKKALQAGADAFMPKPVDLDKLHAEALRLLRVL
jgi:CheY-like chemotaxis protein